LGETPQLIHVLMGLRRLYLAQGALQAMSEVGAQLLTLAQRLQDRVLFVEAHQALGLSLLMLGQIAEAHTHLRQGVAYYTPEQPQPHGALHVLDPRVVCLSYAAWALWLLGFAEQARTASATAITVAQEHGAPLDRAHALCWDARLQQFCRDRVAAQQRAEEALALSTAHGFTQ